MTHARSILALALLVLTSGALAAQGPLRWGGDKSGGEPYIIEGCISPSPSIRPGWMPSSR